MTCIDPFLGNPENVVEGYEKDAQKTFEANIKAIGAQDKVTLLTIKSHDALKYLHNNHFDVIYLDGSHITTDVLRDVCLAWPLLKHGGVIIFDDYQYGNAMMDAFPRLAIDAFQKIFRKEIIELHRGWQMIWRKN
jgi:predicted O-methyltransferase YrrM